MGGSGSIKQNLISHHLRKRVIEIHDEGHYVFHLIICIHFFDTSTCVVVTTTNQFVITQLFPNCFKFCEECAN